MRSSGLKNLFYRIQKNDSQHIHSHPKYFHIFGEQDPCPQLLERIIDGPPLRFNDVISLENVGSRSQPDIGIRIRVSYLAEKIVTGFLSLRNEVHVLIESIDSFSEARKRTLFDIHHAFKLIESFGETIEEYVYFKVAEGHDAAFLLTNMSESLHLLGVREDKLFSTSSITAGRLDVCQCQNLLKCPNGTVSIFGENSSSLESCIPNGIDIVRRLPAFVADNTSLTDENDFGTFQLKATEKAIFTFNFTGLATNMTYGDDYRISVYVNCKPCPIRYLCDESLLTSQCISPDIDEQYRKFNECLRSNRVLVCVNSKAETVNVSHCAEDENHLLYTIPDLNRCLEYSTFCSDQLITTGQFRRLCQDTLSSGLKGPVYDCSLVTLWKLYVQWRNNICCSGISLLNGLNPCIKGKCNQNNTVIERIIRDNFIKDFQNIYGVLPPDVEPLGQFLMDVNAQEDRENPNALTLFASAWVDGPKQVIKKPGCCQCKPHTMPSSIASNTEISGFPDDKHREVYLRLSSLADITLTVVIELLNGRFVNDFDSYFQDMTKIKSTSSSLFLSHPNHFSAMGPFEWIYVIEKSLINSQNLDLPYNLPLISISPGISSIENLLLIDRPGVKLSRSIKTVHDANFLSSGYDDDGRQSPAQEYSMPLSDSFSLDVLEAADWWDSGDKLIVDGTGPRSFTFFGLPFLPYFSNCEAFDSHISLSSLLDDHPQCSIVPDNKTHPVKQNPLYHQFTPVGDKCLGEDGQGAELRCRFEEKVDEISAKNRWYESGAGVTLFLISRDPLPTSDFIAKSTDLMVVEPWGRTDRLAEMINTSLLIPITVDPDHAGEKNVIPRSVTLELQYYQRTQLDKRLVAGKLYFDDLCTTLKPERYGGNAGLLKAMVDQGIQPCRLDVQGGIKTLEYNLRILIYPLDWFALFNRFEFDTSLYMSMYSIVGLLTLGLCASVWVYCRLTTKLRYPPSFSSLKPTFIIIQTITFGCLLAVIPMFVSLYITLSYLKAWRLPWPFRWFLTVQHVLNLLPADWYNQNESSAELGRVGASVFFIGVYISFTGAKASTFDCNYFESKKLHEGTKNNGQEASDQPESNWSRAHFFLFLIASEFALLGIWEFSYSPHFRTRTLQFIFLLKIVELVLEVFFGRFFNCPLQYIPVNVALRITEVLITMGAKDFVNFIVLIFAQKSFGILIKLYAHPILKICSRLWPRWEFMVMELIRRKRTISYEEKKKKDKYFQRLNSDIEMKCDGVDSILESIEHISIDWLAGALAPVMLLLLKLLYVETQIANNYDIRVNEVFYYALFALYMIPWSIAIDVVTLNSLALSRGWRVFEYIYYQRFRFQSRKYRWALHSRSYDRSISCKLWSLDLLGFSSQFFFVMAYCSCGIILTMLSMTILLRTQGYNILSDPATPLLCILVMMVCILVHVTCVKMSNVKIEYFNWRGLWAVKESKGVMDDFIASKFVSWSVIEDEHNQDYYNYLNDSQFRHIFLENNKPWIIQHLKDLITPDTTRHTVSDNQDLIQYLQNKILLSVKDGNNKTLENHRNRPDISSDESEDETTLDMKRIRLAGVHIQGQSLDVAKHWLIKARKRIWYANAVSILMEKSKAKACCVCQKTNPPSSALSVCMAKDGKRDPDMLDHLIYQFESRYGGETNDALLWKSYFQANAELITICKFCSTLEATLNDEKSSVVNNKPRRARPCDISDDDDDCVEDTRRSYESATVILSSTQGRIISRWLDAARRSTHQSTLIATMKE